VGVEYCRTFRLRKSFYYSADWLKLSTATDRMEPETEDTIFGRKGSETSLTLHSSPCPSRLSTQSSFLSGSPPQTPPRRALNLDENPTPSEIATFPFELFSDELRAATPPRTRGVKVAWWWAKGFRMRLKGDSKRLRWVCRLCVRKKCRTVSHFSYESNGSANIVRHLRDMHGIKVSNGRPSVCHLN
jgi:hypothetical protein